MKPELVIVRGLPGSGKSTYAKRVYQCHTHIEADMYWYKETGEYKFDPKFIKEAHEWAQTTTKIFLGIGHKVVVSNTFTQLWEMGPYLDMGYPTKVIETTGKWGNIHNVPQEVLEKMKARWETYPGETSHPF